MGQAAPNSATDTRTADTDASTSADVHADNATDAERSARRRADRLLLAVARDHALATTLNAASTLAGSVLVVLLPAALARAVDAVVTAQTTAGTAHGAATAQAGGAVLGFGLLLAALTAADLVSEYTGPYCAAAATASLRRRFLTRLLAAGPRATRRFAPGDLVGRLVGAAPDAANAPNALVGAAADLVMSAGGIAALGLIDWRLDLAFAATVPVGMLILRSFVRRSGDLAAAYQRAQSEIAARLLDALAGARTIRAAGTRETEARRILAPVPRLSATGRALWSSQRVAGSRAMVLFAVTQTAVLAVAGAGLVDGRLGIGQVLACATYAALGLGFFSSVQAALALAQARGAAMRLAETEHLPHTVYGERALPANGGAGRREAAAGGGGKAGRLELRGVTVHGTDGHDGPALDAIDLTIPAGTGLAVVGAAGSGKSTLAALPGRLVDPDAGTVLLDGVPLRELSHEALRGAVRYAFERPAPLGATVHETIGTGAPRPEVEAAARAAAADGFIRRLPQGYDTPLDHAPLSGGETQRIGLARALTPRAGAGVKTRILVLDDATAALDTVTEARVSSAIAAAAAGHTRIVVAHRPSTAARADLVAWLDHGRLRALAPHQDLWPDPEYRALLGSEDGEGDAEDSAVDAHADGDLDSVERNVDDGSDGRRVPDQSNARDDTDGHDALGRGAFGRGERTDAHDQTYGHRGRDVNSRSNANGGSDAREGDDSQRVLGWGDQSDARGSSDSHHGPGLDDRRDLRDGSGAQLCVDREEQSNASDVADAHHGSGLNDRNGTDGAIDEHRNLVRNDRIEVGDGGRVLDQNDVLDTHHGSDADDAISGHHGLDWSDRNGTDGAIDVHRSPVRNSRTEVGDDDRALDQSDRLDTHHGSRVGDPISSHHGLDWSDRSDASILSAPYDLHDLYDLHDRSNRDGRHHQDSRHHQDGRDDD